MEEGYFFKDYPFFTDLIAGGCCGLAVDSILFPIDTCKTRIQSEHGFWKAGGFKDIYNGIRPVIAASVPIAATFFIMYTTIKNLFPVGGGASSMEMQFLFNFLINSLAGSIGEMFAGLIRTPTEIVKQKRQVSDVQYRAIDILMHEYKSEGLVNGVYRGYGITLMRDIPYSMIQYPLWEYQKAIFALFSGYEAGAFLAACFGSIAGAVAAAVTTPLDAAKTRIQLAENDIERDSVNEGRNPIKIWATMYKENGIRGVFSGFVPRVTWTTIGGFIWFGTYTAVSNLLLWL